MHESHIEIGSTSVLKKNEDNVCILILTKKKINKEGNRNLETYHVQRILKY